MELGLRLGLLKKKLKQENMAGLEVDNSKRDVCVAGCALGLMVWCGAVRGVAYMARRVMVSIILALDIISSRLASRGVGKGQIRWLSGREGYIYPLLRPPFSCFSSSLRTGPDMRL
ncbi:hypothetical protein BU26DRAFT_85344 [Trematosphaeria pertusa]|uniref:Uncharacterized protein n=1 Tax=Trematosphaeria pertusa TaxID=390896 RepID=A0A6A6I3B5_9PLEO|nr:uncharacterized protein BU26DRAFT_85344 [Trematosphaeria pertusa]KAF2244747.1 hypothetical protein BU26DRAFT_85344 [Trematosphaeria pertusa]